MLHKTLTLDPRYPEATLTTYIHDDSERKPHPRPAIVVCPGGGYHGLASHEGEPIALFYMTHGMNAFVLRYGVGENATNGRPLIQAAMAIKHVREHAEEYNIDQKKILILGFSAGGHLAGSAGVLWNSALVREALGITEETEGINRPDGMILCYPVLTALEYRHKGSFRYLLGTGSEEPSEEARRAWSLELHVDSTTPPAFIWHTFNDQGVPVQNSLLMANALSLAKVPCELHVFPDGPHGLGIPKDRPHIAKWAPLSAEWAKELFEEKNS
ncbi:MAG: alpha/beta hydrolase [Clostridia bacterium]|nr:alpha/beta hydrolase [Clostridia bacterium]